MRIPKWFCIECFQFFTRRWNGERHCNNKHAGNYQVLTNSAEFSKNFKHVPTYDANIPYFENDKNKNELLLFLDDRKNISQALLSHSLLNLQGNNQNKNEQRSISHDNLNLHHTIPGNFVPFLSENNQNENEPLSLSSNMDIPNNLGDIFKNKVSDIRLNLDDKLELLSPKYDEMRDLLSEIPEPTKSKILGTCLLMAINSDDPQKSITKSCKTIQKAKRNDQMLNDISSFLGCSKIYAKNMLTVLNKNTVT
ncbi:MAG: hypothetical protein ACPKQO_05455 [Nitrososphaeraceae archaeon]